ncbi:expressed unknown protein [Seminavis robusta]|uniref:Uncharacterized protein n=1 Tax=Seminavis robusta TaxID=568900 RepID=A0A9N8ESC6_9STRA|nr:expressed unknown protein [Seminavis robusta]|eukprot:Sro1963_g308151.1  (142) ;mRNA; f:11363-11788
MPRTTRETSVFQTPQRPSRCLVGATILPPPPPRKAEPCAFFSTEPYDSSIAQSSLRVPIFPSTSDLSDDSSPCRVSVQLRPRVHSTPPANDSHITHRARLDSCPLFPSLSSDPFLDDESDCDKSDSELSFSLQPPAMLGLS